MSDLPGSSPTAPPTGPSWASAAPPPPADGSWSPVATQPRPLPVTGPIGNGQPLGRASAAPPLADRAPLEGRGMPPILNPAPLEQPAPERRSRNLMRTTMVALLAFLVGAAAVAGGYELGERSGDDTLVSASAPATGAGLADDSNSDSSSSGSSASAESATDPIAANAPSDEPVADSAAVVTPGVVQIETTEGLGSGVVYDASGLIITNAHVVGTSTEVNVRMASGMTLRGEVVGAHTPTDIAVVRVAADPSLRPVPLALDGEVKVGQLAVAVGSPFGLDQTVTSGIVSAVNRVVPSDTGGFVGMIQTDAAINSGNSGGALADRAGRVIGINTAIRTNTGDNAGIGFAVPIGTAASVAAQLIAGGPVELGYLGVGLSEVEGEAGVLLTEIVADSPADGVLQTGDVVVSIDDAAVSGTAELATAVKGRAPGSVVGVDLLRSGERLSVEIELGGLEG